MIITTLTYCPTASAAPSAATYSLFPITYSLTYAFSAKERDVETGLSYFGARYYSSDLSIWLSVDPMSGKYPSLSPYVYCADNPVRCVDPNGEEIDWIENKKTKIVEWRGDVRSEEDTPEGHRYIGPTYELPNGAGTLINVKYDTGGDRQLLPNQQESASPEINIEFVPNSSENYQWLQTYSTNFFCHTGNVMDFDLVEDAYTEHVDCGMQSTNPMEACYYRPNDPLVLSDIPLRYAGANKTVGMHFTSSVVNTDTHTSVVSISWGFSIDPSGYVTFDNLQITTNQSEFHNKAIHYAQ